MSEVPLDMSAGLSRCGRALPYALAVVLGAAGCGAPPELARSSPSPIATPQRPLPELSVAPTVLPPSPAMIPVLPTSRIPAIPKNKMPVVLSVSAVPDKVDPLNCTPPESPERPEVIVKVEDPDTPLRSLVVELSWSADTRYQGEARMTYDPRRKAFIHRLPPVTRRAVGERARGIGLRAAVRNGWNAGDMPPNTTIGRGYIGFAGYCLIPPAG